MEFENVNNMNIEESMKKNKFQISKLVHRLKKFLKRAKPQCPLHCVTMDCEEEENENRKNEEIEKRMKSRDFPDMKTFFYTTEHQQAQSQV